MTQGRAPARALAPVSAVSPPGTGHYRGKISEVSKGKLVAYLRKHLTVTPRARASCCVQRQGRRRERMLEQVQCLSLRGSRDHLCSFAGLLGCAGDSILHAMERVVYPTGSGFPQCQRPEVQGHGMGRAGVILRPVRSDLLCMSSHGRPSVYVCILISCPSKDSEPHTCHMTSRYLHELCFF